MRKFRVTVSFQDDRTMIVIAKNGRQAEAIACKRVAKKLIGRKCIRRDWTDTEEITQRF
jgi:hypothetical protein